MQMKLIPTPPTLFQQHTIQNVSLSEGERDLRDFKTALHLKFIENRFRGDGGGGDLKRL